MLSSRPAPLTATRPLHAKTPGRALQKARGILQENALYGPPTAKSHRVQLQTPSRGRSPGSLRKLPKGAQSSKTIVNSVARPLYDKTPFTNRQRRVIHDPTPGPAKANPPTQDETLSFFTPGHTLLPSSVRKTVRGRRSSGPVFETPVPRGNHWDVIEGDAIVPVAPEVQSDEAQPEDYDEIEYMPPTAIDPPYKPHFDAPDCRRVGMQLFDMMHSFPKDDATDRFYAAEKEDINDAGLLEASGFNASPSQWDFFELPEDDPSPFAELRSASEVPKPCAKVLPSTEHGNVPRARVPALSVTAPLKRGQARVVPGPGPTRKLPPTRPATAAGRMASTSRIAPQTAPTPRIPARPATSASLRPQTTTTRTTKLQAGAMPRAEIVFEFESVGVENDDFMFDV